MQRSALTISGLVRWGSAVLAIAWVGAAWAEEATPVRAFREFSHGTRRGLPASSVMDLYQDEQGVLWLATLDGLASFDGEILQGVDAADAPRHGALRSIAPRPGGGFYVGGSTRLHVFDARNWHVLPADDGVDALATRGDEIWRLDRRGRVSRLTGEAPPWMPVPLPADSAPAVTLEAAGDTIYLAAGDRVYRWSAAGWLPAGGKLAAADGRPLIITSLLAAGDGSLWAGSDAPYLHSLPAGGDSWRPLPLPGWQGGRVRALAEDQRGRIWAGGLQGGLAFGRETFTLWNEENGLHQDGILALLADREGSLWIALNGHGLQQWLGEAWTHRNRWRSEPSSRPRHPVFGISPASGGGFYAAVFTRGIWHWDGSRMLEYGSESGLSEDVRYAYEPAPGELWVGARFGIFERRDGRFVQTLALPSGFVYAILPGPGGRHFAITSSFGIYERSAGSWQPAESWNSRLPSTNVRALLFHSNGSVWVGTLGGLRIFGQDGREIEPGEGWAQVPEAVNALLEVDGEVWVAGYGAVAICRDPAAACRLVDPDLLPGQTAYSLARAPDGAIWLGGSAGVGRFAAGGEWKLYDAGSGLIEDECNHFGLLARPDGQVLLGTMASLGRFEPRLAPLKGPPLSLYWTESPASRVDAAAPLPAGRRSLTLRWRAPWLLPRQLEYRVRAPRLGADWLPPQKESFRHFENLGAGEWQVEVAARQLPGGRWTEPIATRFAIAPRFYETNFFRLLCGAALLLSIAGLVHLRTRSLEKRAAELQEAVEAQVATLKTLRGLLPICSSCKKIRDDGGYWQQLESYLRQHSEAELSHGFCPECFERITSALDAARDRPLQPE
jgi:ligand-binding sensor domain-containing protein